MLHLPSELRLIIYRFVLVYDDPIPLARFSTLDCSILRTCSLSRREGIPLFFERNRFIIQHTTFRNTNRLCRRFMPYKDSIRWMTLHFRLGGRSHIDLIWNLMKVQEELAPILKAVLRNFHFLHALSFELTASYSCVQHRTQTEEVLCASVRAGCTELIERIQEQCRIFGTVEAHYLDGESLMVTLSIPRANSNKF